jgi:ribosomal protein L16 Arg81 hydroxylase
MKESDLKLVVEAIIYIGADNRQKILMKEACGDSNPSGYVDDTGRMMDYGSKKSDSHEGRMTKAKLFRLAQMAQRLHDKLVDADDLPEWVQDKITTAEDRIQSAHDYIIYKIHRMQENKERRKMNITKRQLRKIIKEEKRKILREGQAQEDTLWRALDQYVMALDEELGYDIPRDQLEASVTEFVKNYFNDSGWDAENNRGNV